MIVSLTPDAEWKAALSELHEWQLPQLPTLVISPHPDDETLGAGGLISTLRRKGVEVTVVAVTDGEHAYAEDSDLTSIRRSEQEEALASLGVKPSKIVRLGLPDREVLEHEDELLDRLLALVTNECHIVAPWIRDYHPDHEACGRAAQAVAREMGTHISYYFFWMWHRGTPDDFRGLAARRLFLDPSARQTKLKALQSHRSQLKHISGEPILPRNLLGPVDWPFEVFLPL